MTKFSYNWRDSVRLSQGLLWKSNHTTVADYPSLPKCILLLLLVGILWAWCMDRDYAIEQATEAERQAQIANKRTGELAECLNGTAKFITEDQKYAIVCRKAEGFDL